MDIWKLVSAAKNFKSEDMVSTTLPGRFMTDTEGISYWKIDEESAKRVTANLFKGISTNHVILGEFGAGSHPEADGRS